MATIAEGGLFPPIIDAYAPAQTIQDFITNGLRINFNISNFNSLQDIQSIHISFTRQSNYESGFNKIRYVRGVYVKNFSPTEFDNSITIPYSATTFNINQISYNEYYKVQVRLSKITCPASALSGQALSEYLTNESNLINFSEWSTVCLVRFIAAPTINIDGNGQALDTAEINQINTSSLILSGNYIKEVIDLPAIAGTPLVNGVNDLEYLHSYQFVLKDATSEDILFDSGALDNLKDINSFYYEMPYYFNENADTILTFKYTTANLYEGQIDYHIAASYSHNNWSDQQYITEITSVDTVIGKVNITFEPQSNAGTIPQGSIISVRRGSDKDGFMFWDTIWSKTLSSAVAAPISYDDYTIESGILYKYEISYTYNNNVYTIVEGPIISIFDHAFLTGQGVQLCVKFNPSISTFKRNVSDNIVTTLGSQYPYITRNSATDYRSFSLSGTIAYEMDSEHQFTSRSSIYGDWINVYGSYLVNHYFNQRNDRITQRKFREMVLDYFYDDSPKLFRSTPEGNILVRLTDVTLTPKQEIGRMVYDFSCTATEIGDCSVQNFKLYNIQKFND
jgi:hypothetical protein